MVSQKCYSKQESHCVHANPIKLTLCSMGASSTLSDLYDQLNASGDYEFHHVEKYNTAPLIQVRSTV